MDCEKFDRVLMDLLYDELDEVTRAAATRHSDQCRRCRELLVSHRATRESTSLPLTEPPDGFESRIMAAEARFRSHLPWPQRAARAVTILSGYAMRPQLAMAALLLLTIGSSLILLRPKPGSHGSVVVTESGVPQKEDSLIVPIEEPAVPQAAAAPAASEVAGAEPHRTTELPAPGRGDDLEQEKGETELDLTRSKAEDDAFNVAMASYRAGQLLTAQKQFDVLFHAGGKHSAQAELLAAQATEKALGCPEALARFDSVAAGTSQEYVNTALWHSANCRKQMGETKRAALDFEKLLQTPVYAEAAKRALNELEAVGEGGPVLAEARKNRAPVDPKSGSTSEHAGAGGSLGGKAASPVRPPRFESKTAARSAPAPSLERTPPKKAPPAAVKPAAPPPKAQ